MKKEHFIVREAKISDIEKIYTIISEYVRNGTILPRTKEDINDHIRNFLVAEYNNEVIGCIAIKFYNEELVEFRTLVVNKNFQGIGVGRRLVSEGLELVKRIGIKRVFVLTKNERFFEKLGFEKVQKEVFNQKIWYDCLLCTKFNNCDEIAMTKKL